MAGLGASALGLLPTAQLATLSEHHREGKGLSPGQAGQEAGVEGALLRFPEDRGANWGGRGVSRFRKSGHQGGQPWILQEAVPVNGMPRSLALSGWGPL